MVPAIPRTPEGLWSAGKDRTEAGAGAFELRTDADGDRWEPDWPVSHTNWRGARAYLAWLGERTGRPWRLPGELEWEKAARGVDGRSYPFGHHIDPTWCNIRQSWPGRPNPVGVREDPLDESPFGVRGMCGNTRDRCAELGDATSTTPGAVVRRTSGGEPWSPDELEGGRAGLAVVVPPPLGDPESSDSRVIRGGAWDGGPDNARSARRDPISPLLRDPCVGFRGCFTPTPGASRG